MKTQFIPEMLFSSAQGFYEIGRHYAYLVNKDNRIIQRMVPAMVNMSFSIELLLKGLQNTATGNAPKGHSIVKLFNALDKLDRDVIQKTFEDLKVTIPKHEQLAAFTFSITKNSDPSEETETAEDLNSFLTLHDKCFEEWRYFFEYGQTSKKLYANFHLIDCFIRALISIISVKGFKPVIASNMPLPY